MSLYDIVPSSERALVQLCYKLSDTKERLARYKNHLTFLIRCWEHGTILKGLRISEISKQMEASTHHKKYQSSPTVTVDPGQSYSEGEAQERYQHLLKGLLTPRQTNHRCRRSWIGVQLKRRTKRRRHRRDRNASLRGFSQPTPTIGSPEGCQKHQQQTDLQRWPRSTRLGSELYESTDGDTIQDHHRSYGVNLQTNEAELPRS